MGIMKEKPPIKLAEDIDGIGFKKADEIAAKVGIHTDSDFRVRSGIMYALFSGGRGRTHLFAGWDFDEAYGGITDALGKK